MPAVVEPWHSKPTSGSEVLMKWLRLLHRYTGAATAVFMLLLAVTGGALIYKDELQRWQYPELNQSLPQLGFAEHADALQSIRARYGDQLRMVRMPVEGVPAYRVFLDGREALVSPTTLDVIAESRWHQSLTGILFEIHYHMLMGQAGKVFVGVLGILLGLFAFSGLYLWWAVRRQFRWSSLRPRNLGRPALVRFHRDIGAIAAVLLVLFGLTGAGVVFGDATRALLNAVLSPGAGAAVKPVVQATAEIPSPSAGVLQAAQDALPEGALMSWSPPKPSSAVHYFRFRQPGEPHPNGRSAVFVNGLSEAVLAVEDASRANRGDRVANWMFPLHAVRVGGVFYRAIAVFAALALAVISLSGLVAFVRSFRPARTPAGQRQNMPRQP